MVFFGDLPGELEGVFGVMVSGRKTNGQLFWLKLFFGCGPRKELHVLGFFVTS